MNKFLIKLNIPLSQVPKQGELYFTGWRFTDSNFNVSCPKCGCEKGFYCETPKGRKAKFPHTERLTVLNKIFKDLLKERISLDNK